MADLGNVGAAQFDDARLFLHRRDARRDDIATLAQHAPGDRADAARAAGHETADGRRAPRRWEHAHFLAVLGQFGIEFDDLLAGLDAADARLHPDKFVHHRHIEHDAAAHRHGLAIVAGARAARGQGHIVFVAGLQHGQHVGFVARHDDRVGNDLVQLPLEHGAVPKIVAALLLDAQRVLENRHIADGGQESGTVSHSSPDRVIGANRLWLRLRPEFRVRAASP